MGKPINSSDGLTERECEFERELEVFRNEINEATRSFYIWRSVHAAATKDKRLHRVLNRHAAFWNATLVALNSDALIVLGRLFDHNDKSYSIKRLLRLAEASPEIFSKSALENRKRRSSANAHEWIEAYMLDVYVPTQRDFRRLRQLVEKQRSIYQASYKKLRDKVLAHKDRGEMGGLCANASARELEKLLVFLVRFNEALWNLWTNGVKPTLRPARWSTARMLDRPLAQYCQFPEHEWITRETRKFLKSLCTKEDEAASPMLLHPR